MPLLEDMLKTQTLKGFEAMENPRVPPSPTRGSGLAVNPYIRCPLPPFAATVDTLRQFNENGQTPARRVIPLPLATQAGSTNGVSVTNVSTTSSGSGGGTAVTTNLTPQTIVVNIPSLTPSGVFRTIATLAAKSFQLLQVTSTQPIEIRLYGDQNAQNADVVRPTDTAPPFETTTNLMTDVILDSATFTWSWQNRIGANADNPQSLNLYVSAVNVSASAGLPPTVVTIKYLPLES